MWQDGTAAAAPHLQHSRRWQAAVQIQAVARGYLARQDVVHGARLKFVNILKRLDRFAPTECEWHSTALCRPTLRGCAADLWEFEDSRQRAARAVDAFLEWERDEGYSQLQHAGATATTRGRGPKSTQRGLKPTSPARERGPRHPRRTPSATAAAAPAPAPARAAAPPAPAPPAVAQRTPPREEPGQPAHMGLVPDGVVGGKSREELELELQWAEQALALRKKFLRQIRGANRGSATS